MPIYEYRCSQCGKVFGHRFRTLKAAEEGGSPPCPLCGASEVERLISSVAVLGREAGSGGESEGATIEGRSEVFGRKELNKALKDRGY
jgi:putative FmdB family regulatory protein